VTLWNFTEYGDQSCVHIEIWSDSAKAGTKYGGNSSQNCFNNTESGVQKDYTWSSNYPNPSGDFFIHFVVDSGSAAATRVVTAAETCYEDTTYDHFLAGVDSDRDTAFILYNLQ
jgi:hypothetical protein